MYASIMVQTPRCVTKVNDGASFMAYHIRSEPSHTFRVHYSGVGGCMIHRLFPIVSKTSQSVCVGTRKMVNYAWAE